MTYIATLFLVIMTALLPRLSSAAEPVYVAAYDFRPYFSSRLSTHVTGELLKAFNARQTTYQFILREVRPKDRFRELQSGGCCDLLLFESKSWGWANAEDYLWGERLTYGDNRYYTLKESLEKGETSFEPLQAACMGGVFGYHYKYTEMKTAADTLETQFNFYTAMSSDTLLNMLLGKRIDMIILGSEYVSWQRKINRPGMELVTASDFIDHSYVTQVVFNPDAMKQAEVINALIRDMKANGELAAILEQFGLGQSIEPNMPSVTSGMN
ncbi:hypothetical protein CWE15_05230 [Aliidiomarina taiwanensis]|uniref:Solute-binding protein family 3/N-terminal domain-containing protein n=1 Tax=Aliidiomarina taiwanensis TaxID=946228 RepID=A0A432X7I0_9GAMM|nr:ABC transporter substrate-binding protein [Aliidiomarina taiwanensis]RUO42808.1 hypothetical protein CWE15_05230 [Aliidiomarina taiwanensis]